jgi:RNA polymerase sigma-70 factor (ECF subfamily)
VTDFPEDFLALYTSAQPGLQRFVAAHLPDLHEVQDVMQEVAVTLWKNFHGYRPGTSFQKWSVRVAQFKVLHARRAHARRRTLLTPSLEEKVARHYEELDFETVESRRRALEGCLEKLPRPHREIVVARYQKGLSCAQIARSGSGTEGRVRVQLFRIREALRQCVRGALGLAEGGTA